MCRYGDDVLHKTESGTLNGHLNGQLNGQLNGYVNGYVNGGVNGYVNGGELKIKREKRKMIAEAK